MKMLRIGLLITLLFSLVNAQVVINEIHYNPSSFQGSDNDFEFIELFNPGTEDVDMSGYSFGDGVEHIFSEGTTLAAGGYLVVAITDTLVDQGVVPSVIVWTAGGISNGGEDIYLLDASGVLVDTVDYEDGSNDFGDWGVLHDGYGASLELIDASSDNSLAASWQASYVRNGTPGAANSVEPAATAMTVHDIQFTEAANGASTHVDEYVEVSGIVTAVGSSVFAIQDGAGAWNGIYCWWKQTSDLALGDNITVRGYVYENAGYGLLGDPDRSATLLTSGYIASVNSSGNDLPAAVELSVAALQDEQYESVLVKTQGFVTEIASEDNYGEWKISDVDGDTVSVNDRFVVTVPALGTQMMVTGALNEWGGSDNSAPTWRIEPATAEDVAEIIPGSVVINEIHYNPSSFQGSDNDFEFIELFNPGTEDVDMSGYSFGDGVEHIFSEGTTLAAGGYLVVAITDTLVDQGVVPSVIVWTAGGISNGGEDIYLLDASGVLVDTVDYEDGSNDFGDWGVLHDGYGASLELIDASSDNSLAASWQASYVRNGTPGAANSVEPAATAMTVHDIQFTEAANGASTHVDEYVEVSGIVTAVGSSVFAIQDGAGAWNGIYCWWKQTSDLALGDNITVRGYVYENAGYGLLGDPDRSATLLTSGYIASVNSSGNDLPAAVELSVAALQDEQYESVLVKTQGFVTEIASEDNYGEWKISDVDGDTVSVNDRFVVTTPALGTQMMVTGALNEWGGSDNSAPTWRIEPATAEDVVEIAPTPLVAAPTPAIDPIGVISLFSSAYTDVTVDTWSTDWDVADVSDVQVAGDDVKLYTNLSYAGIETTTETVDATAMTHFHMDIWTSDPTADPAVFKVKLVDFGADGAWSGGDDTEHELTFMAPLLTTGNWVGIDVPLSDFTGMTAQAHLAQYIISGDPNTVYMDNMYFYDITTGIVGDLVVAPTAFTLNQNYPNPFNPTTTLRYGVPEASAVSLIIYDIRGNVVRTMQSETRPAGWYEVVWNGLDDAGQPVSTGLYLTRLQAGSFNQTIKMLFVK